VGRGLHLSDEDKARVRAEEVFRHEIRSELEKAKDQPSRGERLLAFLNEPVILWLLSSIVVGLITWQYTLWQERQAQRQQVQTEVRNLDLEIHGRLRRAAERLSSASDMVGVREAIRMLDEPSGTFPEMAPRNFENLLISLTWLMPEKETAPLEAARRGYLELQALAGQADDVDDALARDTIERVRTKYFDGVFAIRRWRG
jgi:hypothetical protein